MRVHIGGRLAPRAAGTGRRESLSNHPFGHDAQNGPIPCRPLTAADPSPGEPPLQGRSAFAGGPAATRGPGPVRSPSVRSTTELRRRSSGWPPLLSETPAAPRTSPARYFSTSGSWPACFDPLGRFGTRLDDAAYPLEIDRMPAPASIGSPLQRQGDRPEGSRSRSAQQRGPTGLGISVLASSCHRRPILTPADRNPVGAASGCRKDPTLRR